MNNKKSTLISLGISIGLLAAGIWFLFNHFRFMSDSEYGRFAVRHMSMHGDMEGVTMIFWLLIIGAVALLISGVLTKNSDSPDSRKDENSKIATSVTQNKA